MALKKAAEKNFDNRYHREAYGFPSDVDIPTGNFSLEPTRHAKEEAKDTNKRDVDGIDIPDSVDIDEDDVFEIYTRNGYVVRMCARVLYDGKYALCFAIDFEDAKNLRTVWLNRYDDLHSSLDMNLYDSP